MTPSPRRTSANAHDELSRQSRLRLHHSLVAELKQHQIRRLIFNTQQVEKRHVVVQCRLLAELGALDEENAVLGDDNEALVRLGSLLDLRGRL